MAGWWELNPNPYSHSTNSSVTNHRAGNVGGWAMTGGGTPWQEGRSYLGITSGLFPQGGASPLFTCCAATWSQVQGHCRQPSSHNHHDDNPRQIRQVRAFMGSGTSGHPI